MSAKNYKVGLRIEAWCTKCKMDREHAIETLKSDGNINRVMCQTCQGSHLFRRPKGEGKAKSSAKRRKKAEATFSEQEVADAKPYVMEGEFDTGDVIKHSRFGTGRVAALKPGGKMEVAFEDGGSKLLVCKDVGNFLGKRKGAKAKAAPAAPAPAEEE